MKFDFSKPINRRNEGSEKWNCPEGVLPMWVADMDFEVAPCIQKTMQERISHPCYGYTAFPKEWALSYVHFFEKHFHVSLKSESLCFSLGVIPSLSCVIRAFSNPGDEVVLLSPVYNIFDHSAENSYRKIIRSLLREENGVYSIDWGNLESCLLRKKAKIMVLCNPHNPVGKVWSKEELSQIASLASKHNVLVISDEVHGPINGGEKAYTPYFSVSEEARLNSISLFAPTKAFNIAGVMTSSCYCENPEICSKLAFSLNADELAEGNFLSYPVVISAFEQGDDWLREMNEYVHRNYLYCLSFLKEHLPQAVISPMEATYLLWVDLSKLIQDDVAFCEDLKKKTGLWITPGSTYGPEGKGHVRINLATQRSRVEEGMKRLVSYFK